MKAKTKALFSALFLTVLFSSTIFLRKDAHDISFDGYSRNILYAFWDRDRIMFLSPYIDKRKYYSRMFEYNGNRANLIFEEDDENKSAFTYAATYDGNIVLHGTNQEPDRWDTDLYIMYSDHNEMKKLLSSSYQDRYPDIHENY
ncbi:MAG: hypothetical protein R3261_15305, partial [Alphaproteobacteria bacterium]|nr:hypothetical protein [Alphaproteobacteria bacterium]